MSRVPSVLAGAGTLPVIPGAEAAGSVALARALAALPDRIATEARGVGPTTVEIERIDPAPTLSGGGAGGGEGEGIGLRLPGCEGAGRLVVPAAFARALVRAAIGAPPALVEGPLGPTERGVLGALVAHVASSSGLALRVQLDGLPGPRDVAAAATVVLRVRAAGHVGDARLEVPAGWLDRPARTPHAARLRGVEIEARLELARTALPARSWAEARPGDAVVFEGTPALEPGASWPVRMGLGPFVAAARWGTDGGLAIEGPFLGDAAAERRDMRDQNDGTGRAAAGATATMERAIERVMAEAPVEVVAEVGRIVVSASELGGLTPGVVLALGPRRSDAVTLRSGGGVWARGELVAVEGELAVRITEVLGR